MKDHTPGPWVWTCEGIDEEDVLRGKDGELVMGLGWAVMGDAKSADPPNPQDAALIAAAPELLEFTEAYLRFIDGSENALCGMEKIAREAVRKANEV